MVLTHYSISFSCPARPLPSQFPDKRTCKTGLNSLGYTQRLCQPGAEEGSDVEGWGGGAPGAWNVNWEDCFNKALIFANAGRGLAGGATQAGGGAARSEILSANTTDTI